MGDVWNRTFDQRVRALVPLLKQLDAWDARRGEPKHDGRFHVTDLVQFADSYSKSIAQVSTQEQTSITRLFQAAAGLKEFVNQRSSESRRIAAQPLADALIESARAIIEHRKPNFNAISGFSQQYIDVEFEVSVSDITAGKVPNAANPWKEFWRATLEGCHLDLFVTNNNCPF